jgi:hypothetical protein
MIKELTDYREEIMKALIGLPQEKIHEVIDFIGYLKLKENRKKEKRKTDSVYIQNPLLSLIGIGESSEPHDLAQNHDKYAYSGDV